MSFARRPASKTTCEKGIASISATRRSFNSSGTSTRHPPRRLTREKKRISPPSPPPEAPPHCLLDSRIPTSSPQQPIHTPFFETAHLFIQTRQKRMEASHSYVNAITPHEYDTPPQQLQSDGEGNHTTHRHTHLPACQVGIERPDPSLSYTLSALLGQVSIE